MPFCSLGSLSGQLPPTARNSRGSWVANFYLRFIQDYSKVVAPLTSITSILPDAVPICLHRCRKVSGRVRSALLHASSQFQRQANLHHVPTLSYLPGQGVSLSSKDLSLQADSRNLIPHFLTPFVIDRIVDPSSVHVSVSFTQDSSHFPCLLNLASL